MERSAFVQVVKFHSLTPDDEREDKMSRIERIAQNERVQAALHYLDGQTESIVATATAIQQIAAPTFAEGERAAFLQDQFESLGLHDVSQDGLHNVYGHLPASTPSDDQPPLILTAHSDTVFPANTDLTIRRNGRHLYGPGLGDNASGLAGLLHLAQLLLAHKLVVPRPSLVCSQRRRRRIGVTCAACRQLSSALAAPPNISWSKAASLANSLIKPSAFNVFALRLTGPAAIPGAVSVRSAPSMNWAISSLPSMACLCLRLPKPRSMWASLRGGMSINSIARSASLLLDLRSEETAALTDLTEAVRSVVANAQKWLQTAGHTDVTVTMTQIGHRPAGSVPRQTPLVAWAEEALRFVGCQQIQYIAGSTDANVPLSQGIAAVCVGLTESGNAHRLDEFIDPTQFPNGLRQLLLLTLAAGGFQ